MSTDTEYLAVFMGGRGSPRRAAWDALAEAARTARARDGVEAWKQWMVTHADAVAATGGPLGRTLRISPQGIEEVSNLLVGFVVVRAPSHEAAAKLFEGHPHFAILPGDSIEVMPVLPVPAG